MDLGGAEKLTRLVVEGLDPGDFKCSVLCLKAGGFYAAELRRKGYQVDELLRVKKDERNSVWLGVKATWRLWRYLRRSRPDVLHTHLFITSCLGRLLAPFVGVKCVVVTLHRVEYPRIQRCVERLLSGLTALYVTDSEAARGMLVSMLGIQREKVRVIHNGIDREEFNPPHDKAAAQRLLGVPSDCVAIGIVAHLYREKGHAFLFESLALAKPQLPRFRLLVVGDGYMRDDLENLALDLGLSEEIVFLGQRGDLGLLLSALDILVLPSSWEGFGIVLAEAMYVGVPVITTRNGGGCAEVVADGDGGLLVDYGNRPELAKAIVRLAKDGDLRRMLGAKGRVRVDRMFTSEVMVAQYASMYRHICGVPAEC
jgi:glycosyltransferase involved in cell wall biosynthesis